MFHREDLELSNEPAVEPDAPAVGGVCRIKVRAHRRQLLHVCIRDLHRVDLQLTITIADEGLGVILRLVREQFSEKKLLALVARNEFAYVTERAGDGKKEIYLFAYLFVLVL